MDDHRVAIEHAIGLNSSGHPPPNIPNYELLHCIGRGGYGEVWMARTVIGEYRAVKVVYRKRFEQAHPYEREFAGITRFEPISRSHPGLVNILHIGRNEVAGYFYYVMELADDASGCERPTPPQAEQETASSHADAPTSAKYVPRTLRVDLQHKGRLEVAECLRLGFSLASALGHLHQHGLVHRDIKPSNIIFVNGLPKLADIGLVAEAGERRSLVGTEGYVAPEGTGTAQADLYSLGKLLYELCTGKDARHFPEPLTRVAELPDLEQMQELNEIILKACNHDPRGRYGSATALQEDLVMVQSGRSLRRLRLVERRVRFLGKAVAAVIAVSVLIVSAYLYQQRQAAHFKALADENRRSLVRLSVSNGLRRMEGGDLLASLPWFAEALRLDEGDAAREDFHRRRIESILRQCPRLTALGIHQGPINHAQLSPDAKRVVTASSDSTACVWDAANGARLIPQLRHDAKINYAEFSPDGRLVLTASEDRTARLWNAETGAPALPPFMHDGGVNIAKFSPDGRVIVTLGADGVGKLWSVATGRQVGMAFKHDARIECAAFSPDSRLLITGSADCTARLWDVATGEPVCAPLSHEGTVRSVAFSPDGSLVATGCAEDAARIWRSRTGEPVTPLLKHSGAVWHVEFNADGSHLITAGGHFKRSGEIRLWGVPSGTPLRDPIVHSAPFRCAHLAPGERWIAAGSEETVRVYDRVTGSPVAGPFSHGASVWSVEFSRDGRRLLTAGKDGLWRLWDLASAVYEERPLVHRSHLRRAEFTADGSKILTMEGGAVLIHDSKSFELLRSIPGNDPDAGLVATDLKGRFGSIDTAHPPWVCDLETGATLLSGDSRWQRAEVTAFQPDGTQLVVACGRSGAVVYNLPPLSPAPVCLPSRLYTRFAVFSPNGKWIATGSGREGFGPGPGEARLWNSKSGVATSPPLTHSGVVVHAAFTPDSRFLITAHNDATVAAHAAHAWRVPTGEDTGIQFPHTDGIGFVAVSPDGKYVGTASDDGTARVWDLATGRPVGQPLKHKRGVQLIRFSPDGRRVITASGDRTARVWEAVTGTPLTPWLRHAGGVHSAVFAPDGEHVFTASEDQTIRVWDVSSGKQSPDQYRQLAEVLAGKSIGQAGELEDSDPPALAREFQDFRNLELPNLHASAAAVENWHYYFATRYELDHDWAALVFHLERLSASNPQDEELQFRLFRARVELGRERKPGSTFTNSPEAVCLYPSRKPDTPGELLDLSRFYNAPLLGNWRAYLPDHQPLPFCPGVGSYAGVDFDVRGIVQLAFWQGDNHDGYEFPRKVLGIPVKRFARKLHFLHGIDGGKEAPGAEVARYVVHYDNGRSLEINLRYGDEIASLRDSRSFSVGDHQAVCAWQGQLPDVRGSLHEAKAYRLVWTNPLPEREIVSLDFISRQNFPFLLGITVE